MQLYTLIWTPLSLVHYICILMDKSANLIIECPQIYVDNIIYKKMHTRKKFSQRNFGKLKNSQVAEINFTNG